ncbi:thioredoxin O1, mitochondrial isoform X2 [Amborella trichopoda]|uniref:thioredoxin O1, mitochondrial isoform X2 n=1 Tax=Amborella trichopoda TaxID=13333 RepID=UPI0009BE20F9|nr:thioredoxin O1, mitochondrial isoform X2 [Amborella trichopoda]|eukprot:XP_020528414.1 thioredoxin O1, mitochondrial isoform X2 [Amborella trichopoda]
MRISLLHRIVRGRGSTRMCTAFLHSSSSTPFIPPTNIPWRPSYSFEHHYSFPSSSSSSIINPRLSFTSPPHRALCSSTSGTSDIVTIKSDEEFESSIKKVQDDSLPAIFYFTAVWCGPCKFISPIIEELSKKYSHVKVHKVDVDQEGLQDTLSKLQVNSVVDLISHLSFLHQIVSKLRFGDG